MKEFGEIANLECLEEVLSKEEEPLRLRLMIFNQ